MLNTTFAPNFGMIYRLTPDKMPHNEIVTVPIPGLSVGPDCNIYSTQEGFVTFFRESYETMQDSKNLDAHEDMNDDTNDFLTMLLTQTKESRVANIYRPLVYHPFIRAIHMSQYGWSEEGPVPDDLTAISWMDGTRGQLKLVTSEENLDKEKQLKIKFGKHSAACTST